jgi:Mg-chelatase subunit ChlD
MNPDSTWRRLIMSTGYAATLLLLLLALWNPSLPLGPSPVDLLLLLDESNSIDPSHNDAVWQSFLQQGGSLPAGSRISLMRFSDRASVEVPWTSVRDAGFTRLSRNVHPPRHRVLDPSATAIGPALRTAMQQIDPDRHSAIILSSDGFDSVASAETAFPVGQNNNLSLFFLESAGAQQNTVLQIESINTPSATTPGQSLPLSIAVESANGGQGTIETMLNGRVVNSQSLMLKHGDRRVIYLNLPTGRSATQMLEFIARDPAGHVTERRKRMVENLLHEQLLYVGNRAFSPEDQSLQRDNWQVVQLQPQRLPTDTAFYSRFDVVLLDDVDANEISTEVTRSLVHAVQRYGTGLIVLGGPHSFGSGGYRHSVLENALPVVSESSRPVPGAAFLFLLDKSGSMEAANRGNSRLADALRAVSESAKSLRPGDESALMAFDRDVDVLLPLKHRADPVAELDKAWQLQPAGGTRLVPALEQAVELLAHSDSHRRFVIVVTDGFVDAKNTGTLKRTLQQADIQLIALAIGKDADLSSLNSLAAINGGRVLTVDDTAELPRFMRRELETTLHSWRDVSITPRNLHRAPFISEQPTAWRSLPGYQVTRARPTASVYVTTDEGDPLLAVGQAGAGRVAALPGGLLEPVSGANLLGGLLAWLHSREQNPDLKVSHSYLAGKLTLVVDAVDPANEWNPATEANVILTSPDGTTRSQPLQAIAPGRYSAVIDAPAVGVYDASIEVGNEHTLYHAYSANDSEGQHHVTVPWLQRALASGDIRHWTDDGLNALLASSSGRLATRSFWLMLALACYLFLIVYERSGGLRILKESRLPLGLRRKILERFSTD